MPDVRRLWKYETVTPWPFSMLEYQKIKIKQRKDVMMSLLGLSVLSSSTQVLLHRGL